MTAPNGVPLLDPNPPRMGKVTRKLTIRTAILLGVIFVAATTLVAVGDPALQALGLSLLVPGGGFLYGASPILFVLSVLLFGLAMILWWGLSATLAPWLVMAVAAIGSMATMGADGPFGAAGTTWWFAIPVGYATYLLTIGSSVVQFERRHRLKVAAIAKTNDFLSSADTTPIVKKPFEPTPHDSEYLKWLLDLGTQPRDEFVGFEHGEQYHGFTALRYQLHMLGNTSAVAIANLLPNYPDVARRAASNFVAKNTDIRVWRYWLVESILGNFSSNPDPIVRDNIMFSGFLLSQIGLFEAATGSTEFDEAGSLTFVWPDGRKFVYDHHSISEVVRSNFAKADLGLFPCEPGWIFTVCNVMGAQGLRSADTVHGTDYWTSVEKAWRAGVLQEMMTPDGGIRHLRSQLFGFTFNDGDGTGEYFTAGSHGMMDVAPDVGLRGRLLQTRGVAEKMTALHDRIVDGELNLNFPSSRERGTGRMTPVKDWFGIVAGAVMMGDYDLAEAAERGMWRQTGTGQNFPDGRPLNSSVMMLAMVLSQRWGTLISEADLAIRGWLPPVGPVLEHAPWPEVLVSKARSDDAVTLDLIIEPHRSPSGTVHEFTFQVGSPRSPYRLVGAGRELNCESDEHGRFSVSFPVVGRACYSLAPSS